MLAKVLSCTLLGLPSSCRRMPSCLCPLDKRVAPVPQPLPGFLVILLPACLTPNTLTPNPVFTH